MLATEYENLINDTLIDELRNITERKSTVIYARDTRESGPHLVKALKAALDVLGVESTDYGFLTTPQLHYVTRCLNTAGTDHEYGVPTEEGYYMKMAEAFKIVMIGRKITGTVTVDCANGVGGPALQKLIKYLPPGSDDRGVDIKVVNDDTIRPEALNFEVSETMRALVTTNTIQCGADYVKTKQRAPPKSNPNPNERCCSLDGDADRIVYYYTDEQKVFHLLDGDRIATLGAVFIVDLVRSAGLEQKLSIGLVQTAYANGASTEYARDVLKLQVICTPTGVKHLHHAAARNFDIGVYFEANGHGTVLFSAKAIRIIHEKEPMSPGQLHALQSLKALIDLINQTVGDALSDMLLTEVVLAHKCWTPNDWENTYIDMPNRLVRVEVADRSIFKTTDAERKLVEPRGIQDEIDKLCQMVMSGRAFARASGTEDAVRVYAEAHNRVDADSLAAKVADVVRKYGTRVSK
jgi:phosphoacetylglucosamine mutase